jgi:glycosyltransferase involved in cell wall biosynthesis
MQAIAYWVVPILKRRSSAAPGRRGISEESIDMTPLDGGHDRALRIAMLAPPWIPVPAPAYGGIEEVVRLLCDGLTARGHAVTLFAPPGSDSCADVVTVLETPHPDDIQKAQFEADHVARAFAAVDEAAARGEPYDVIHDHVGHTALAMADRVSAPLVHTLHGPFTEDACRFYAQHGSKACIVAISLAQLDDAPPEMGGGRVVHNPIDCDEWPFRADKDDFLLWIGRMSPDKGPHRAIAAAREAGAPLVLAGPVQPGQESFFEEEVEPHIGHDDIEYIGEADSERKRELYQRARALLMPIRWPEPFGLVMVEALACGTPVIAFPEGSAPEVVQHGDTGFVVDDEHAMAQAVQRLDEIDPAACRRTCEARFGVPAVVAGYEEAYGAAAEASVAA